MTYLLSVVVCTYNPNLDFLAQMFDALAHQTLSSSEWELIIVDNASDLDLASHLDLNWHPHSRCLRENQLGVVYARMAGIGAASAEIIVFVDDDNVLEIDYLEQALAIGNHHTDVGAWGGQTLPRFEVTPPAWTQDYWSLIGLREIDDTLIADFMYWPATPIGAGLCIRKSVAKAFVNLAQHDPQRTKLGRKGKGLMGCEDLDLAYTTLDLNLKTGVFKQLKLYQLMPPFRLEEVYLLEILRETEYSTALLHWLRQESPKPLSFWTRWRIKMPWLINPQYWLASPRNRRFGQAATTGRLQAMREILTTEKDKISRCNSPCLSEIQVKK
jgi:glycosyltransferase involved in cell wall biosynthesis